MENEIWKEIPGYEGLYEVSNYGQIRYRYTPHGYSRVKCLRCGCVWIAHAKYVELTKNIEKQQSLF